MPFPVSEDMIAATEALLGFELPSGLRSRLRRQNGGSLEVGEEPWSLYPVRDNSNRKRLSRTANDVITETAAAREWANFPTNGIAVAGNGYGDVLFILPGEEAVYLWRHETGEVSSVSIDWRETLG